MQGNSAIEKPSFKLPQWGYFFFTKLGHYVQDFVQVPVIYCSYTSWCIPQSSKPYTSITFVYSDTYCFPINDCPLSFINYNFIMSWATLPISKGILCCHNSGLNLFCFISSYYFISICLI
jgi:hypothetical protein